MATEMIGNVPLPARLQEYLYFMDDFGTEIHQVIPMTLAASDRASVIAQSIAGANVNAATVESYLNAIGADVGAAKTKGSALKAARRAELSATS